jgi:transketolase
LDSPLEGHPTPRLEFVDLATGSLGQGLSAGVGMAIHAQLFHLTYNTYVLLGDGEMSEGSVWEAISLAASKKLTNLCAIVDVNRLGQSQETAMGHQVEIYRSRLEAFGWRAISIDGHSISEILSAFTEIEKSDRPLAIIAKTIKGKGIPGIEDLPNWHGKPLSEDKAIQAIDLLQQHAMSALDVKIPKPGLSTIHAYSIPTSYPPIHYQLGQSIATRKAFGSALARLGRTLPQLVVLDGDVQNSTYTENFAQLYPERFIECYIAEQNMVGISTGLAALGKIPVSSTFAAFYTRAFDQIRMAGISRSNIKMVGTHAGVSIGEDGPSQMGLEDLAVFCTIPESIVLYPADAVSTEKLIEKMLNKTGLCYLRASRSETEVIYSNNEEFEIGGAKILRQPKNPQITIIGAGITVFEALKASDALHSRSIDVTVIDMYSVKPFARDLIFKCARKTNNLILTVEDHYWQGGIGDQLAGELSSEGIRIHKLAIRELPHSGKKNELLDKYRIDAKAIEAEVTYILSKEENRKKVA